MKNRKRNRLMGYDYSRDNLYFVTKCVKGMLCCLGEIIPGAGTGRVRPGRVRTGRVRTGRDLSVRNKFLPDPSFPNSDQIMVLNQYGKIVEEKLLWLEEQYPYAVLHNFVVMPNHLHAIIEIDSARVKDKSIKIKSLSSLFGAFGTTSSKMIHQSGFLDFAWHRSFHDHIIKNDKSYCNISNYIDNNPSNWNLDKFFSR